MNKLIVTTSWDDGTVTDLKLAELLSKYELKGTFYVTKQYSRTTLKPHEIQSLSQEFEIGSHTLTHPILTNIPIEKAENEIKSSKIYLEDVLGCSVNMLSYPYGRYSKAVKQLVHQYGYIGARTTISGYISLPEDVFEWKVTQYAALNSPVVDFKILHRFAIPLKTLFDWEMRAKLLFDIALQNGGIYHLWGHSRQVVEGPELRKLERVFAYISKKTSVSYECNTNVMEKIRSDGMHENSIR